ncbi:phosphoribosyl-AMP cyclohydrolase [Streptomyces sp. MS1.HAVA.3]|uniref:Phosphoribosyl-AMP cyclohydrolase n=1 Tax=Streptomyces caledonius TaxID=3134107 RepID=A0ABU8UA28_9ACTN
MGRHAGQPTAGTRRAPAHQADKDHRSHPGPAQWPHQYVPRPGNLDPAIAARLKRSADGLVPAIAQQYDTGEVLMLGWMDDEALHRTLTTGRCTYWSRSRQEYWVKGDTSGHFQHVKSVALDCDADTVLVKVDQVGAACHTGTRTCFDDDVLLRAAD